MIGLGTWINCGAVAIGTTVGLFLKGGLPKRFEKTILSALGMCAIFISISGVMQTMLVVQNGKIIAIWVHSGHVVVR